MIEQAINVVFSTGVETTTLYSEYNKTNANFLCVHFMFETFDFFSAIFLSVSCKIFVYSKRN